MKALVTGGAGFIGSHLVKELLKNHQVLNYDKLTYAGCLENLKDISNFNNYKFICGDILNEPLVFEVLNSFKPDIIFHLAAESHVDKSIDGCDLFIKTNVEGTQKLLQASLKYFLSLNDKGKKNFKFIHVSTDEVFGSLSEQGVFSETSPYQPNSPYAASKAASDMLARAFYKTYSLPVIITNCSNNFGPNQYPEKLIPLMIINAMEGKNLPVYGKGEQIRDWLFVKDHVNALIKIANQSEAGEQYCIGGGTELKNIEIVTLLCEILDQKFPQFSPHSALINFVADRPGHDFRYAIDASKIKDQLNWTPQVLFRQAFEETIQWYIENQDWIDKINHVHKKNRVRQGLFTEQLQKEV